MVVFSPSNAWRPDGQRTQRAACEREYCYCEKRLVCEDCIDGTLETPMRLEVLGFVTGTCDGCQSLNGTFDLPFAPFGFPCQWSFALDNTICPNAPPPFNGPFSFAYTVTALNGDWIVQLNITDAGGFLFESAQWRLSTGTDPLDCSEEAGPHVLSVTSDFITVCNNTPATVTLWPDGGIVDPPPLSAGAMRNPDCEPEFRRGKPVIPKGRRRG